MHVVPRQTSVCCLRLCKCERKFHCLHVMSPPPLYTQECTNPCCNANTCQLVNEAECSTGTCCDLSTCRFRPYGTQCRSSSGSCDIAEYCSGDVQDCPQDLNRRDASTCNGGNDYCYDGTCQLLDDQCQFHFGMYVCAMACSVRRAQCVCVCVGGGGGGGGVLTYHFLP